MKFSNFVQNTIDKAHTVITVGVYDEEFDCISRTTREAVNDARYINDCSGNSVLIKSKNGIPLYLVSEDGSLCGINENGLSRKSYKDWLGRLYG